jgi:hypothetical protein
VQHHYARLRDIVGRVLARSALPPERGVRGSAAEAVAPVGQAERQRMLEAQLLQYQQDIDRLTQALATSRAAVQSKNEQLRLRKSELEQLGAATISQTGPLADSVRSLKHTVPARVAEEHHESTVDLPAVRDCCCTECITCRSRVETLPGGGC